ncbi:MAG: hypothetical protein KBA31_15055 [Alphaproteobacteria bacterium]|nr:hypothetical protein [Alphaproteobacteria bacterium]
MNRTRATATVITIAVALSTAGASSASNEYTFPSANGVQIATTATPSFNLTAPTTDRQLDVVVPVAGTSIAQSVGHHHRRYDVAPPLPIIGYGRGGDAFGYRFLTHALMSAAYSNYAADQARLFAPAYAVSAWTDRVFGVVDVGYGAVDGWTAATYDMRRLRGPSRRSESVPDLSLMPTLRAHPELQQAPTFEGK